MALHLVTKFQHGKKLSNAELLQVFNLLKDAYYAVQKIDPHGFYVKALWSELLKAQTACDNRELKADL